MSSVLLSNITNDILNITNNIIIVNCRGEYGLLPYLEVKTVSDVICLKCDFYGNLSKAIKLSTVIHLPFSRVLAPCRYMLFVGHSYPDPDLSPAD